MWCALEILYHLHNYIMCFLSQLGYLLSNFYQLHVLMRALRTHDMMILGEWMGSWFQNISSGNESRARKEKMMKWVFQTLARDHNWTNPSLIINHVLPTLFLELVIIYQWKYWNRLILEGTVWKCSTKSCSEHFHKQIQAST